MFGNKSAMGTTAGPMGARVFSNRVGNLSSGDGAVLWLFETACHSTVTICFHKMVVISMQQLSSNRCTCKHSALLPHVIPTCLCSRIGLMITHDVLNPSCGCEPVAHQ